VTDTADTQATASARPGPTAGGKLKAAREAAGLSVDAVAQQLKLAPRQVKALEDDDWHRLPGRTFVRGFARNYARFVQLDPDAVLALLPTPDASPALERPTLAASPRPMGEIPVERVAKPAAVRWLLALLLLAVIVGIAYYESPQLPLHLPASTPWSAPETSSPPAPTTAADTPPAHAVPGTASGATSALPSPIAGGAPAASDDGASPKGAESTPPGSAITPLPIPSTTDAGTASAPAAAAGTSSGAPAAGTSGVAQAEVPLVLAFKGTSWAEVKDAKGRVVLQMTGGPGMTQTVSAMPPLELALGNAREVGVTFRGQALDLSPYTRGNVARVSLQ
jgi:cytoskeleton protein RodZ